MAPVEFTEDAMRQAQDLPTVIKRRLLGVVARLEKWPEVSGAKPLRGELAGHYRVRTGDYRIQFFIDNDVVVIEKVGHRDGFYDE